MADYEDYVDEMTFEALLLEADNLGVPHDEGGWLDDEYPDKEDELRVEVINAYQKKLKEKL